MWWLAVLAVAFCVVGLWALWSAKDDFDMAEQYKAPATGFGDSE